MVESPRAVFISWFTFHGRMTASRESWVFVVVSAMGPWADRPSRESAAGRQTSRLLKSRTSGRP